MLRVKFKEMGSTFLRGDSLPRQLTTGQFIPLMHLDWVNTMLEEMFMSRLEQVRSRVMLIPSKLSVFVRAERLKGATLLMTIGPEYGLPDWYKEQLVIGHATGLRFLKNYIAFAFKIEVPLVSEYG
jgi:hypothetical protein